MPPIDLLSARLQAAMSRALTRPWEQNDDLERCVATMRKQIKDGSPMNLPSDQQADALARFWSSRRIETLRQGRLVCFGLTVVAGPKRMALIEDYQHFRALLDGVEEYQSSPRPFRRLYQGLLAGYFDYDPRREGIPVVGKENWETLRRFLDVHAGQTAGCDINPDWIDLLQQHLALLSSDPCRPYGPLLLDGQDGTVNDLRKRLSIPEASWFTRSLILSTVAAATQRRDSEFVPKIPHLLQLLSTHDVVHDAGLATILDRYAGVTPASLSKQLREAAVKRWGNPWLEANRMRWGRVSRAARELVADWLKLEFIEAFFSVLADERTGDTRRPEFWKRYVHSIEDVRFALGADARESKNKDLVELRRKMDGLQVPLQDAVRANNAFIMRMGKVTVVEFGAPGNACYFYDGAKPLPFDVTQPLVTPVGAPNSLKHKSHTLKLRHQDGIGGHARWEDVFEGELLRRFHIAPAAPGVLAGTGPRRETSRSTTVPLKSTLPKEPSQPADWQRIAYTREHLTAFATRFYLPLDDLSMRNGNLWVRTDDSRLDINAVLRHWGFAYRASKGWWK
jgi:hypothetical protein